MPTQMQIPLVSSTTVAVAKVASVAFYRSRNYLTLCWIIFEREHLTGFCTSLILSSGPIPLGAQYTFELEGTIRL